MARAFFQKGLNEKLSRKAQKEPNRQGTKRGHVNILIAAFHLFKRQ